MKIFVLFIVIFTISCNSNSEKKIAEKTAAVIEIPKDKDIYDIEKNGRSFYDWYLKNDFPNCEIISDQDGKCTFDTITYFTNFRKLGTISEKFIKSEKDRLQMCQEFISTIDFSDYQNAEAYDYSEYCVDLYYMYWIKSQEPPNRFSTKNVKKISASKASVDIYESYGENETPLSTVSLEKENTIWKITQIKFINREDTPAPKAELYGQWQNSLVIMHVGKEGVAFEYHGQCMYFYPVKKISITEFEMIWSRDMDCKFDNGTANTFDLKNSPIIGKPFAKYTLKNNILYADYYYKEWVTAYTSKVQKDVFTSKYFIKNEND